ncbi:MAG TPA: NADP-dependent phosphogluconate dehydrogenase, partial [Bacillota bacterium]|nr:NADP-dependent phosphogluconate dehydrogenase [Bacillota bacterium]
IMPGGSKKAWELAGGILTDISAKAEDGTPCCGYLGPGGAGHFVKMVHNGIEYVDMQIIAEAYHIMRDMLGIEAKQIAVYFREWNKGELGSYLIEITSDVLDRVDDKTGRPLVDVIKDAAAQKGTGLWTAREALALGTPAPSLAEAVFARNISARRDQRLKAAGVLAGPEKVKPAQDMAAMLAGTIEKAMLTAKISAYAQGFALLKDASDQYGWNLDLGGVALLWRGGCIIRARFLDDIKKAFSNDPKLENLILDPSFADRLNKGQAALRQIVSIASMAGIPIPAMGSSLSYYDGMRCTSLPANLIQGQRDYFGAHTYERLDIEGSFHTDWYL